MLHRGYTRAGGSSMVIADADLVGQPLRRSSSSASATSTEGTGPPRSRAARRRAVTNRSSESMVSMSRTSGAYAARLLRALHP
jgi:hypothetical protein